MLPFRLVVHFLATLIICLSEAQLYGSETLFHPPLTTSTRESALATFRLQKPRGNCSVTFVGEYEYTGEGARSVDEESRHRSIILGNGKDSRGRRSRRSGTAASSLRLFSPDSPWRRLLRALDRAILADSVRITDGVFLVKDVHGDHGFRPAASTGGEGEEVDEDEERMGFVERILRRLIVLLETHAIRVRLGTMASTPGARIGGHGYRHAFPLMVGSFALLAAFFVPLGFQFLAVVAGKALILSQIAIIVAMAGSIQRYLGLRGSNYGAPAGVVQHDYHLGAGEGGYWHREDSTPEPLGPSRLQAYFNGPDTGAGTGVQR